jgi:hypothetical protein
MITKVKKEEIIISFASMKEFVKLLMHALVVTVIRKFFFYSQ